MDSPRAGTASRPRVDRLRLGLALVAAALFFPRLAAAQRYSLTPQLSIGAGYDDNLFLDPTLASATPPRADAIIDIEPSLAAQVTTHEHSFWLAADYLARVTPSNGQIHDVFGRLGWTSRAWHRLQLTVDGVYEHYAPTLYPDNTFDLGGGELALRILLPKSWLQAAYRADARGYSDPSRNGQLDVDQWASATASVRVHRRVAIEGGYRFFQIMSNEPSAVLTRHRLEASLSVEPARWLDISVGYAFWRQSLPSGAPSTSPRVAGGPRTDFAHAVSVAVSARPLRWLEIFARYQLIYSTSDATTGDYQLNQVVGGLALSWPLTHIVTPPAPPLMPVVRGHEVTFRARARPGAAVAIVGDWNDWRPAPLASAGGDAFAGTYTLPSGKHAFALSIDGNVTAPPVAEAFVDDGFGGKNGVVNVP